MCGINGIFAYSQLSAPIELSELLRSRDYMAARGPDGEGAWIAEDGRVGFGHRRLAIVDLTAAGKQPMVVFDGKYAITFNGEIYNYRELRKTLEKRGYIFHSTSDTEVLIYLYIEKGIEMLRELRGMFAFAIWDQVRRSLFIARDPYGIKPLYYCDDGRVFRMASQVKALIAGGAISRESDPAGRVGFLLWGSVPEPFTTYRSIRCLPAGCFLTVRQELVGEPRRYHSIAAVYCEAEALTNGAQTLGSSATRDGLEENRDALQDAVRHHLVSDVPVGAFLSAGIDSGALVGLMRDVSQAEIRTITIAFEEFHGQAENEAPLAAEVARTYGTKHHTRVVTEQEFRSELPKILAAMDQPSIDGINTWFVSKAAHECGLKVAISGLGGDELFGGYPSFRDIPRWVERFARPARIPMLGKAMRSLLNGTGLDRLMSSPKAAGALELGGSFAGAFMLRRGLYMPWELDQILDRETAREGLAALRPLDRVREALMPCPGTAFAKVASLESSLYMRNQLLRDTDWASMAHGLEVRVPLVDSILLKRLAVLGPPTLGLSPKESLFRAPGRKLPDAVLFRNKTGFVVPIGAWLSRSQLVDRPHLGSIHSANGVVSRTWARRILEIAAA